MSAPRRSDVTIVLGALLALCCWMSPAQACSMPDRNTEQGWRQAISGSDEVFVARLLSFREVMPPAGEPFFLNQSRYQLVETFKGAPDASGTLSEADPMHPVGSSEAGPMCGPFVITRGIEGALVVVFVSRKRVGDTDIFWVHPYSQRIDATDLGSAPNVATIRALAANAAAPP